MDNPQAKSEELAWLAGILDGEGSFLFLDNGHKGSYKGKNVVPVIYITNTCGEIIDYSVSIMTKIGFNPRVYTKQYRAKETWRPAFRIDVNKYSHMAMLIEAILPYLRSKGGQARLMMRFLKAREGRLHTRLDDECYAVLDEYFEIYAYRVHSKPQRLNAAPAYSGEDKVRPAVGNSAEGA